MPLLPQCHTETLTVTLSSLFYFFPIKSDLLITVPDEAPWSASAWTGFRTSATRWLYLYSLGVKISSMISTSRSDTESKTSVGRE